VKPVAPHPEAEAEFHDAVDYYEERSEGLGVRFREEIEAAVERIAEQPNRYPIYEATPCRQCPVTVFPYAVYYIEEVDRIWIVALAHQRRKPGYWLRRLRDR
jgi:plasmid stabilization system protein ParE